MKRYTIPPPFVKLSGATQRRPSNLFCALALAALCSVLGAPTLGASTTPIYLDYRYASPNTVIGPRQVKVVGPNPFRISWTVQATATTIPGPDVSSILSKSVSIRKNGGGVGFLSAPPVPALPSNAGSCTTPARATPGPDGAPPANGSPTPPLESQVTGNNDACAAMYQLDATMVTYTANMVVETERRTADNVDYLLRIPGGELAAGLDADSDASSSAREQYFNQYNRATQICIVNSYATDAGSCTLVGLGPIAQWEQYGDLPSVQKYVEYAKTWQQIAAADYAVINGNVKNSDDAEIVKNANSAISSAMSGSDYAKALTAATDTSGVFSQAPTFVTTFDPPNCGSLLWNGLQVTYTLSMSSNPANQSSQALPNAESSSSPSPSPGSASRVAYAGTLASDAGGAASGSGHTGAGQGAPAQSASGQGNETQSTSSSVSKSAVILCPPPAFLTFGFGGDTIQTSTYTTVPANTAAIPLGGKAQPAIIRQKDKPPRAIFSQLVNYQFSDDDSGSGAALTLGTGFPLNDAGPGWPFEIVVGPSYTFRRGATLTVAGTYGSTNQLQPGYTLGGPIKAKMTPPTTTQNAWGLFIGLSFYRVPTGTATAGPNDHPKSDQTKHP
jgi:hypothetical protein